MSHFDTDPLVPPPVGIGALALILNDSGNVLLVRPTYTNPEKYFQLPGGGAGEGEPDWEAVVRETYEETGLVVAAQQLLVKDWMPAKPGIRAARLNFVRFCGQLPDNEPITLPPGTPPELDAYRWVAPAELDGVCADYQALRIHAALHALVTGTLADLKRGVPFQDAA